MHIRLRALGHVVIEDMRNVVDIETAGGNIGRDQDIGLTGAETPHDTVALGLRKIAMERFGRIATRHQRLAELIDHPAWCGEDHGEHGDSASRMRVRASILRFRGIS